MPRPAGFDRNEVLERAARLFWDRGYCATSVSDLVQATRLRPGSLYAAFDSKEGLLLAALDHYGSRSLENVRRILTDNGGALAGIVAFLDLLVAEGGGGRRDPRGCFLVNTALEVAPHNERVRRHVRRYLRAIERAFADAFRAAVAGGELEPAADPARMAGHLMATVWGIRVMQRLGTRRSGLRAVVDEYLRGLGLAPGP
ncbi:MAG TPA: TetR/AcrR family transcriptional regulator [Sedimenticola thiotaurini]|uniref:TetR/AcrR family transcriptional regulator n=1 Tax=Sedimenticola thiotaurini TaxID=1543721 RepID=A0A831RP98_9GAMM|nr:TetR/AcrR family transcriptional regulator [Sedimenticola thiotaurini]